ncbi:MAG: hypothetical protein LBM95_02320 [Lactobacillales bacterium]|jgi:hypothetical protein|nr:hypothetical protein [Lactobacillales bacterium]
MHGSVLSYKKNNARAERLMNASKMNAPSKSAKKKGTYQKSKADLIEELKAKQLAAKERAKLIAEKMEEK